MPAGIVRIPAGLSFQRFIVQNISRDQKFYSTLARLAFPIALQQAIFSSLNALTLTMIGQLGETAVAAFGLANQIMFLLQLLLFGVTSGAAIFAAQYWGKRDLANIRRVLGICLALGLAGSAVFSFIALCAPEPALGVFTRDPAVIALGRDYLRIIGVSYFAIAITTSYTGILRSTENVRLPVIVSSGALTLGAVLNYALIFGQFGLPALGVQGSAVGATIARWVECAALIGLTYAYRLPAAARPREMFHLDFQFLRKVLGTTLPVMVNEIAWSIGITAYSFVFARVSTEAIAAVSIATTIEWLAFVPFHGLASAGAIMIGNRIGAGEEARALAYAQRFLLMVIAAGILMGSVILLASDSILGLYNLTGAARGIARDVLTIIALALWVKVSNMVIIVGVLRAGGDTRYSFLIDVGCIWLIGIPAAFVGAFVLHLPAPLVYLLTISDEVAKMLLGLWRVVSRRWVNNLTRGHAET